MEKPKCRLCGERHYGLCVSALDVRKAVGSIVSPQMSMVPSAPPPIRREGVAFDRVAYQREYMRRYRARKKAEGGGVILNSSKVE